MKLVIFALPPAWQENRWAALSQLAQCPCSREKRFSSVLERTAKTWQYFYSYLCVRMRVQQTRELAFSRRGHPTNYGQVSRYLNVRIPPVSYQWSLEPNGEFTWHWNELGSWVLIEIIAYYSSVPATSEFRLKRLAQLESICWKFISTLMQRQTRRNVDGKRCRYRDVVICIIGLPPDISHFAHPLLYQLLILLARSFERTILLSFVNSCVNASHSFDNRSWYVGENFCGRKSCNKTSALKASAIGVI